MIRHKETLYIGANTVQFAARMSEHGLEIDCKLTSDSPSDLRDLMEHGVIKLAIERAKKTLGVESC